MYTTLLKYILYIRSVCTKCTHVQYILYMRFVCTKCMHVQYSLYMRFVCTNCTNVHLAYMPYQEQRSYLNWLHRRSLLVAEDATSCTPNWVAPAVHLKHQQHCTHCELLLMKYLKQPHILYIDKHQILRRHVNRKFV